jgi:predicted RNase H-like HicB family nuclease
MIHHEEHGWWAESPDLPGLSVAEDSRESLLAAIKPAVEYYIDETPRLQERPVVWLVTNEHVRPVEAWNETRTA